MYRPTQAKDFLPFVGYFFARSGEKITYLKKESTVGKHARVV
jgi:hypothetical protein